MTGEYWLNVTMAAALLGVSRRTIYYWIRNGRIGVKRNAAGTGQLVNVRVVSARRQANRV